MIRSGDGVHRSHPGYLDMEEHNGVKVLGWLTSDMKTTLTMLIDKFQVDSVIEVGSYLGLSAIFFAERVGEVVCVDRFDRPFRGRLVPPYVGDDHYSTFLRNTKPYPNIASYKMDSLEAAELDLQADLVYIDAGHEYDDVKSDVEAWTPHARKVICGDDNTEQWPSVQKYAREIDANTEERVWWKPV